MFGAQEQWFGEETGTWGLQAQAETVFQVPFDPLGWRSFVIFPFGALNVEWMLPLMVTLAELQVSVSENRVRRWRNKGNEGTGRVEWSGLKVLEPLEGNWMCDRNCPNLYRQRAGFPSNTSILQVLFGLDTDWHSSLSWTVESTQRLPLVRVMEALPPIPELEVASAVHQQDQYTRWVMLDPIAYLTCALETWMDSGNFGWPSSAFLSGWRTQTW